MKKKISPVHVVEYVIQFNLEGIGTKYLKWRNIVGLRYQPGIAVFKQLSVGEH